MYLKNLDETQGSESKKKITEKLDQYKKSIKSLIPSDFILSENEKDSKNYAVNESEKIVDECEDEQFSVSSEQLEYSIYKIINFLLFFQLW